MKKTEPKATGVSNKSQDNNKNSNNDDDPNKKNGMLGANGPKIHSKTVWNKGKKGHLDVENPNPGGRQGQIHLQQNGRKYLYNPKTKKSDGAPNAVNNLLKDADFTAAIKKAMKYLGE